MNEKITIIDLFNKNLPDYQHSANILLDKFDETSRKLLENDIFWEIVNNFNNIEEKRECVFTTI